MLVETSVSKRMPIKGVPYSSQCFSITIRNEEVISNIEEVREKCVEMHGFLEQIVDQRLSINRNQPEIIAIPKTLPEKRKITDKQIALIHKLMAENEFIDEADLQHAMESTYSVGKITDLSTVEASRIIEALMQKDLSVL